MISTIYQHFRGGRWEFPTNRQTQLGHYYRFHKETPPTQDSYIFGERAIVYAYNGEDMVWDGISLKNVPG